MIISTPEDYVLAKIWLADKARRATALDRILGGEMVKMIGEERETSNKEAAAQAEVERRHAGATRWQSGLRSCADFPVSVLEMWERTFKAALRPAILSAIANEPNSRRWRIAGEMSVPFSQGGEYVAPDHLPGVGQHGPLTKWMLERSDTPRACAFNLAVCPALVFASAGAEGEASFLALAKRFNIAPTLAWSAPDENRPDEDRVYRSFVPTGGQFWSGDLLPGLRVMHGGGVVIAPPSKFAKWVVSPTDVVLTPEQVSLPTIGTELAVMLSDLAPVAKPMRVKLMELAVSK